jgi:glucose/arabinose dehydrogenase
MGLLVESIIYFMEKKKLIAFFIAIATLILVVVIIRTNQSQSGRIESTSPSGTFSPTPLPAAKASDLQSEPRTKVIASKLEIPWDIVFLPDNSALFTERHGRVRKIEANGQLFPDAIADIKEVYPTGEGGLLGITISPKYIENNYVYLYFTYQNSGRTLNKVQRYIYENGQLKSDKTIIDGIPGALHHDGGRIRFGPDGFLYITTGDSSESSLAQDKNSLAGKILRVDGDGGIPSDNPFGNSVYSYGHRNPEGIAWDETGRLWETEHGSSATDELNIIEKGANYGWPVIRGNQKRNGMVTPVINSGVVTWAPSGAAYLNESIFFAGLRGSALFEAKINGDKVDLVKHLENEFGRLRAIVVGPDGFLYLTTSNRDGRGAPATDDDRIIKVNPSKL